jgi:hypothetical protein
MRDALCLKPDVDVTIEVRGEEIAISKPKVEGNYTEYYVSTLSRKLKESIEVKKVISEEVAQRHGLR